MAVISTSSNKKEAPKKVTIVGVKVDKKEKEYVVSPDVASLLISKGVAIEKGAEVKEPKKESTKKTKKKED